ncbi:hypothetical protein Lser_V15G24591 [Lactuca serriola]
MEWEADEKEVKAAGAELLPDGRRGLRIHGWEIESSNRSILTSLNLQSGGKKSLSSGTKIHFNAFDALLGWKKEALPPVEVPAAAHWKFRRLRVDGALMRLRDTRVFCTFNQNSMPLILREICWRETSFKALASKGYPSDSASYNDQTSSVKGFPLSSTTPKSLKSLPDTLLTSGKKSLSSGIKVHFNAFDALLAWKKEALPPVEVPGNSEDLRVDGALMRLRDTRVFCTFNQNSKPLIIREICWRETTFKALASVDAGCGKKSLSSGIKVHFNAFDALLAWKKEALPPVEVPGNSEDFAIIGFSHAIVRGTIIDKVFEVVDAYVHRDLDYLVAYILLFSLDLVL